MGLQVELYNKTVESRKKIFDDYMEDILAKMNAAAEEGKFKLELTGLHSHYATYSMVEERLHSLDENIICRGNDAASNMFIYWDGRKN